MRYHSINSIKTKSYGSTNHKREFQGAEEWQPATRARFLATWCGPCRLVGPILSELAEKYDGKIIVGKCDVEENEELAMEFGIRNIPTILFFKGGQQVDKVVGAMSKQVFDEKFQSLL